MSRINRKSQIPNGDWLPDMDLNHDKQIQSLLCYRYTIGQAGACDRLMGFAGQSSRQTRSEMETPSGNYARPHPGPLPRGEGEATRGALNFDYHNYRHRFSTICCKMRTTTHAVRVGDNLRTILPPLGERAGVRAD